MKLVTIVYGNDDPTTSTQVTQGLLQQYPNLKGIISPTTVGIAAAAAVLDTAKYRGKIQLTGLGTPNSMKKYVNDGTVQAFELWNPADLGYLAAYAAVELRVEGDHEREGPDVHRRQARQVHGRRGPHDPARRRRTCSTRRTSRSSTSRTHRLGAPATAGAPAPSARPRTRRGVLSTL